MRAGVDLRSLPRHWDSERLDQSAQAFEPPYTRVLVIEPETFLAADMAVGVLDGIVPKDRR
jgi:hypothetical protein